MTCPDADTLAALASLGETERAAIADHAAGCASCRAVVLDLLGVSETAAFAEAETAHALAEAETVSADGAVAEPSAPAETIDRYRIERRIGAGAMGVVYAAHDPELARPVAVKVLRAGGSRDRMRREAQALAKLTHPNVVAVYDVGEHDGATFVTMALVDGDNLRAWLREPRTTEARLDAIVQAARGVDAAHRAGIVHRDLKPDNIFVARTGEVLVGDFGLARSDDAVREPSDRLTTSSELTRTGAVVGTPAYMAPEQIEGEASAASDQFALCVTAWEALYGARPFTGATVGELAAAVRRGPPAEPRTRRVPAHVRAAIRRGLAADPAARHPSMTAFLAALSPRRRRWPYAVVGLGAAGAALAVLALRGDPRAEALARCEALPGPPAWTGASRARALAGIAASPVAPAVATVVDRYAAAWTALARSSCAEAARRELAEPVRVAIRRCLDRRAATLAWALAELAPSPFERFGLIEGLEPVESCRTVVSADPPSPALAELHDELDRATVLVNAASKTAPDLTPLVARATELAAPAALAEATYLQAVVLHARGRDAEPLLRRANDHAEQARDDRVRARALALLAAVSVRTGRTADAQAQRDLAAAAAARSPDPATAIAVEQANVAVGFARGDVAAELAALRRIEALQVGRYGELSAVLIETRFALAVAMQRAGDPGAGAMYDRTIALLARMSASSPRFALELAAAREVVPAVRARLGEQIVALDRREAPERVAISLTALGYEYEVLGDDARALAVNLEALALVGDAGALRPELIENAANHAFEVADHTDDKALRARRLEQALALIDQLPPEVREGDAVQSVRGRALLLQGRPLDAVPPLTAALAAAERAEPPHPYRLAVRAFSLAQALWDAGGARDRDRARALADQAAARMPEARAMYEADRAAYGAALDRLERQATRLDAWRRTHR